MESQNGLRSMKHSDTARMMGINSFYLAIFLRLRLLSGGEGRERERGRGGMQGEGRERERGMQGGWSLYAVES